jgi:hypothetical protein
VLFSVPARLGVEDLSRRLGHVLDELHVAVDLCRWMVSLVDSIVITASLGPAAADFSREGEGEDWG